MLRKLINLEQLKCNRFLGLGMGSLFSQEEKKPITKLLILGPDSAGKTAITYRFGMKRCCPMGNQELYELELTSRIYQAALCNVPSWELIRAEWRNLNFFKEAIGIIYMIDSTREVEEVQEAGIEMHKFLREEKLQSIPIVFFANKQDRVDALPVPTITRLLNLSSLQNPCGIFPTDAISGEGVWDAFDWLMATIREPESYVPFYYGEQQVKSANKVVI